MEIESVTEVIKEADRLTKSPENYLGGEEKYALELRDLIKKLYDFNKYNEPVNEPSKNNLETLNELVIDELDEEQIWQQIELKNKALCKDFISDVAHLKVKKNYLKFLDDDAGCEKAREKSENEDEKEANSSEDQWEADEEDDKLEDKSQDYSDSESDEGDEKLEGKSQDYSDSESDEYNPSEGKDNDLEIRKKSVVDDKFFKLSEMEKFLEKEENEENVDSEDNDDELIDYFEDLSDSDDEKEGAHYDDFFDQPQDDSVKRKRKKTESSKNASNVPSKKKVKFELSSIPNREHETSDFTDDDNDFDEEDDDDDQFTSKKKSSELSAFEVRQERLKSRIKALEEEALKEKPWQLKGEVTASNRPQNSLLEEFVEFDTAVRPPPVMTEKTTLKLEDIIIQRIKDKAWDDVERKIKPVEDPREYRKRLVLDQEKSKLSLAQIYEQEYLKKKEALNSENMEEKPEEIPSEHLEIDKMMKSLFYKLDALSNFHFTPKMVTAEVKVVSNLPAITVEEVAPTATSDAALLAPEEIKPKMKGDLIGKTERTKTDKKRERRMKKKKQRMIQKALEKKGKLNAVKIEDLRKKNKKTSKKLFKKFGQNVSQANENGDDKYIRSSSAFFTKLQDEVQSHIKSKSKDYKKKEKNKQLDVKKLKL